MTARTTVADADGADARWGPGEASDAMLRAIAEARGVDPLELDPIYDSLDLDAVDRLFASADVQASTLTVEVAECRVTLRADGRVSATPLAEIDRVRSE